MRVVGAKIVSKRTFLHLEADTADDCTLLKLGLRRSVSSPALLVDSCSEVGSEDNSTTVGSPKLSPRSDRSDSEQFTTSDNEEYSSSSRSASDMCEEENAVRAQTGRCSSPQQEQVYYFVAVPAWGMTTGGQGNATSPQATQHCQSPNAAANQAQQLQAQAAELRAEAARLKAQASHEMARVTGAFPVAFPVSTCEAVAQLQAPKQTYGSQPQIAAPWQGEQTAGRTTLMLRNIPNDYTRAMLLELMDCKGLAGKYDFVYLPIDFDRMAGLGYAFVNFASNADAELARLHLHGFRQWSVQSPKVCEVRWGEPLQGLEAHIERYRSSPVMHRDVPDQFKPVILQGGVRVPFPAPTRRIRAPRSKRDA